MGPSSVGISSGRSTRTPTADPSRGHERGVYQRLENSVKHDSAIRSEPLGVDPAPFLPTAHAMNIRRHAGSFRHASLHLDAAPTGSRAQWRIVTRSTHGRPESRRPMLTQ